MLTPVIEYRYSVVDAELLKQEHTQFKKRLFELEEGLVSFTKFEFIVSVLALYQLFVSHYIIYHGVSHTCTH